MVTIRSRVVDVKPVTLFITAEWNENLLSKINGDYSRDDSCII